MFMRGAYAGMYEFIHNAIPKTTSILGEVVLCAK